jgi:hypothetical protein
MTWKCWLIHCFPFSSCSADTRGRFSPYGASKNGAPTYFSISLRAWSRTWKTKQAPLLISPFLTNPSCRLLLYVHQTTEPSHLSITLRTWLHRWECYCALSLAFGLPNYRQCRRTQVCCCKWGFKGHKKPRTIDSAAPTSSPSEALCKQSSSSKAMPAQIPRREATLAPKIVGCSRTFGIIGSERQGGLAVLRRTLSFIEHSEKFSPAARAMLLPNKNYSRHPRPRR